MAISKDLQVTFVTDPDLSGSKEFLNLLTVVPNAQIINFYTMDMTELAFIAKHRILPANTILIMSGSKVVCRIVNKQLKKATFKKLLKDLQND